MLRGDNERKDQLDKPIENTMSREEFIMHNEDARKVYEDIKKLRKSVEDLKASGEENASLSGGSSAESVEEPLYMKDSEEVLAAKRAILQQAEKDALAEKQRKEEMLRREAEARIQQQKVLEAQRRAALIEEEAERKRRQAAEAERLAKKISRKTALEAMEAERRSNMATEEEIADFFAEEPEENKKSENSHQPYQEPKISLEEAKHELLFAQKQQEASLDIISNAAERHTMKLAEVQQEKLDHQKALLKSKQKEVESVLDDQKEQKLELQMREEQEKRIRRQRAQAEKEAREKRAQQRRAEKLARAQAEKEARAARAQAEREARAAKMLAEREAKAAKIIAEREAKRIREEKKRLERLRKAEERELIKKAKRDAEAKGKLERLRLEAKSREDAEMGGGIVNVKGVTINTEIKEVPNFKWRDLFGLKSKEERHTESEEEKKQLEEERKQRAEEARKLVDISLRKRREDYEKTNFAKKFNKFKTFCDKHKTALLAAFAVVLTAAVAAAGVCNYYTAYAYSYNGKTLGFVKEKDDVLQITELVQDALTEDKNVDVIIDARKDVEFDRVWTGGEAEIDTSEDVLKRLTYMGDLNVKAYCIFVGGKKVGAVESKDVAEEVFREIEDRYKSHMENSEVEKIEIVEKWEAKEDNISLEKVVSKDEMLDLLCTSGQKESLHTVVAGETLADVAKLYSTTEDDIIKDNPNMDRKKLVVGDKLIIRQEAPIMTVRITEKVTYDKVMEHKVEKKDSQDIYEGYSETQQTGEDGLSEVTSRIVLVNGEQVEENPLVTTVKKEPVTEIVLVGAKERPPSVGSGKFIWPLKSGKYTITSRYGPRWGRFHSGVDLGLPTGNKVFAADGGIVVSAGYSGGYGYMIAIDHQNGMETRYAHNSKLLVDVGDEVFQGMEIAKSGNSGNSTGPHLHFEIRVNGNTKNPLNYLP